ncbi:LytR/AlgR family response regulator transcription factor [Fibrivirga algicola]|uniref:Response regulator transcription factor n=1 Tax=Fibrivirga algicola TaxID=2950420 RepID=A0ABX0QCA3_9BACT|nr:LytTR family DNA-binding domain-containing protein [Fibrivirga algicola]ARK12885.1 DNA-binding response regulator [Fibrella sp. ES10-3-2-2]NID09563.1 response regulator transcription factor [Fibrivirga algicola]
MTVLIVEDEELAVRKLRKLIDAVEHTLQVQGVTGSIEESVSWLQQHPAPDLIFMDIELADGQSFEIFEQVEVRSRVIFTTSYDEYALQAFRVNSIDYLLKPIQKEDLQRSLKKLRDLTAQEPALSPTSGINIEKLLRELQGVGGLVNEYRKRFLVKHGQKLLSIQTGEILYFYTDERISFFKTHNGQKFLVDYTLDELADSLDPAYFFRANRGLIISHQAVEQIQPYFGNRLILTLKPAFEKEALVSRERVSEFKVWMGK